MAASLLTRTTDQRRWPSPLLALQRWSPRAGRLAWWGAGLLLALLVTAPAWLPWTSPDLNLLWEEAKGTDDAKHHMLRLYLFEWLTQRGVWYPRWAPDLFMGYGYPVFNYYAPGVYYTGLALRALLRQDVWDAYRSTGVLAALLGAERDLRPGGRRLAPPGAWGAGRRRRALRAVRLPDHALPARGRPRGPGAGPPALAALRRLADLAGRDTRAAQAAWLVATALATAALLLTHSLVAAARPGHHPGLGGGPAPASCRTGRPWAGWPWPSSWAPASRPPSGSPRRARAGRCSWRSGGRGTWTPGPGCSTWGADARSSSRRRTARPAPGRSTCTCSTPTSTSSWSPSSPAWPRPGAGPPGRSWPRCPWPRLATPRPRPAPGPAGVSLPAPGPGSAGPCCSPSASRCGASSPPSPSCSGRGACWAPSATASPSPGRAAWGPCGRWPRGARPPGGAPGAGPSPGRPWAWCCSTGGAGARCPSTPTRSAPWTGG